MTEGETMDSRLRWRRCSLVCAIAVCVLAALAAPPARAAEKGVTRAVTAAQLQEEPRFDVLVFSRTTGFRHSRGDRRRQGRS